MSYPSFGKVKTIVLPIEYQEDLSLDQYKEKYGIDLRDFFEYSAKNIKIKKDKFRNAILCLQWVGDFISLSMGTLPLSVVRVIEQQAYDYGNDAATLKFAMSENEAECLQLFIPQTIVNPTFEDVRIIGSDI